jgi:zinc protease
MNLLDIQYEKYKLENDLEVILHQNKLLPVVSVNIWYKVGSANEKSGKTGLAHLFEHMMFQGSENVEKEMHFRYIQESGGSLNGSTSFDRTNYYEKVPANFLELALWLESDRMGFFLPALTQEKLDNQKSVVMNERLERYDNQPYGLAWEKIITSLYPDKHPYSWPTIGFMNDIESYSLKDVSSFFQRYYSPNNATMVVAGDIEIERTKELIGKYFGEINSIKSDKNFEFSNLEIHSDGRIIHEDNVQLERLYIAWPSTMAFSDDDAKLDVLSDLLSGSKNSRLYKKLVFDKEIAQDVSAFQFSGKYAGHFMIIATAKPGISLDDLKSEIIEEIEKVQKKTIAQKELERSRNSIKSNFIYSLQNLDTLADQLNLYNFYLNEPNSFSYDLNRYQIINQDDVSNAAKRYLSKQFIELQIIPKKEL